MTEPMKLNGLRILGATASGLNISALPWNVSLSAKRSSKSTKTKAIDRANSEALVESQYSRSQLFGPQGPNSANSALILYAPN
jgi:hypothetical protein